MKTEKVLKIFAEAVEKKGYKKTFNGIIEGEFFRFTCIEFNIGECDSIRCEQKVKHSITGEEYWRDLRFIETLRFLKMRIGL